MVAAAGYSYLPLMLTHPEIPYTQRPDPIQGKQTKMIRKFTGLQANPDGAGRYVGTNPNRALQETADNNSYGRMIGFRLRFCDDCYRNTDKSDRSEPNDINDA